MKAQSSLEFLMTYGWAVLIIFIVTAVFVNFGLGNPDNYANERCLFESDFSCEEFGVVQEGSDVQMEVVLVNQLPFRINVTDFEFIDLSGVEGSDVEFEFDAQNPVGVGNNFRLIATIEDARFGIDLFKARGKVTYEIQRPGYFPKNVYGNIVARIN